MGEGTNSLNTKFRSNGKNASLALSTDFFLPTKTRKTRKKRRKTKQEGKQEKRKTTTRKKKNKKKKTRKKNKHKKNNKQPNTLTTLPSQPVYVVQI